MAKSAAVTGVSSPGLMNETPACVSHTSIVFPEVGLASTVCISHLRALHSCIARCTALTAAVASAARSPPHAGLGPAVSIAWPNELLRGVLAS